MTPKKILIVFLVVLGLAAYVAGSFWVVGMIKQGTITLPFIPKQNTAATTTSFPQAIVPGDTTRTTQRPTPLPTPTPQPTPTPIPTPTPLLGPGRYACDGDGICGDFSNERRQYCPKTFADRNCLGMCGTPSVRCSQ